MFIHRITELQMAIFNLNRLKLLQTQHQVENPSQPLVLPDGYQQTIIASEPSYGGNPDMNTLNETGPQAGRYLYQTHEVQ